MVSLDKINLNVWTHSCKNKLNKYIQPFIINSEFELRGILPNQKSQWLPVFVIISQQQYKLI